MNQFDFSWGFAATVKKAKDEFPFFHFFSFSWDFATTGMNLSSSSHR
jgi:hypothetical protein